MNLHFNQLTPQVIIVDNFYKNPQEIIDIATVQPFFENNSHYKGKRSQPNLFPYVKEEFERLLNTRITDWLDQPYNGVFQITKKSDPIVWHSDTQDYAAAVYLTKDAENMGTSFWKHKVHGIRRPPQDENIFNEVYTQYNFTHEDNWELVDKVGSVFNRLVIWDAKLIHSASEYADKDRLVQLFFFSVQK